MAQPQRRVDEQARASIDVSKDAVRYQRALAVGMMEKSALIERGFTRPTFSKEYFPTTNFRKSLVIIFKRTAC